MVGDSERIMTKSVANSMIRSSSLLGFKGSNVIKKACLGLGCSDWVGNREGVQRCARKPSFKRTSDRIGLGGARE